MNVTISRYQQYWELLKKHRGIWVELQVPAEYHRRIYKALYKRKNREESMTAKHYPPLEFIMQPVHPVTKKPQQDVLHVRLPLNPLDTI